MLGDTIYISGVSHISFFLGWTMDIIAGKKHLMIQYPYLASTINITIHTILVTWRTRTAMPTFCIAVSRDTAIICFVLRRANQANPLPATYLDHHQLMVADGDDNADWDDGGGVPS